MLLYLNSVESSCHTAITDLPDPHSPLVPIVHRSRQVTSCIGTELLYIGSSWLSYLCSSMGRDRLEYIAYVFVLTSLTVSRMSGWSNLDSFRDKWLVAIQLLFFGVLPPGLVQYTSQHSCVIVVKLFLHKFS